MAWKFTVLLSLPTLLRAQLHDAAPIVTIAVYPSCGNVSTTRTLWPCETCAWNSSSIPALISQPSVTVPSAILTPISGSPSASVTQSPGYVTSTRPYNGSSLLTTPTTITTILPSGSNPGTYIVETPSSGPPNPGYATSSRPYTGPRTLSSPTTVSTVFPSGTVQGTYIVETFGKLAGYVTSYWPYTGATPLTADITITTILPSGTTPGTYIVEQPTPPSPPAMSESPTTSFSTLSSSSSSFGGSSSSSSSALPSPPLTSPTGSATETYSTSSSLSSETPPGTQTSYTYGNYAATTTLTTIAVSGSVPATVIIGVPTTTSSSTGSSPPPPGTITSYTYGTFASSGAITTFPHSGSDPAVVLVGIPVTVTTTATTSSSSSSSSSTSQTPLGTVTSITYGYYPSTGPVSTILASGSQSATVIYGIPLTYTTTTTTSSSSSSFSSNSVSSGSSGSTGSSSALTSSSPPLLGTVTSYTYGTFPSYGPLSTIAPSGSASGTVIIGIPVTITTTTTTTSSPSSSLGPSSSSTPTSSFDSLSSSSQPAPGTVTSYAYGTYPASGPVSTIPASGSVSGTLIIGIPVTVTTTSSTSSTTSSQPMLGTVTSYTYGNYPSTTPLTTIEYSGTVSGTIIYGVPVTYTTTSTTSTTTTTSSSSSSSSPSPLGTVTSYTYGNYPSTTPLTTIEYSGTVSGTIIYGVPITYTTTTSITTSTTTTSTTTTSTTTTDTTTTSTTTTSTTTTSSSSSSSSPMGHTTYTGYLYSITRTRTSISLSSSSVSTSSSSTSPTPTVNPNCTFDGYDRTDSNGIAYRVACGRDLSGVIYGPAYATGNEANSFEECYTVCDATANCQGFVWLGASGSYGNGAGNCYFKGTGTPDRYVVFVGGGNSASVAALRSDYVNANPTATTGVYTSTRVTFTSSPPTVDCGNTGYLVQDTMWYTVNIDTGEVTPNGTISGVNRMQAIGYNPYDHYIYGTSGTGELARFGSDLNPQILQSGFVNFQTGDVDANGQYWALRSVDSPSDYLHLDANPSSATYGSVLAQGTVPKSEFFFADWAFVPGAGTFLWGIGLDATSGEAYLYRFDQDTLKLDLVGTYGDIGLPKPVNPGVNFGAVYASTDGYLYGSENLSGYIYKFTVLAPLTVEFIADGPSTQQNDGARCIENPAGSSSTSSTAPGSTR